MCTQGMIIIRWRGVCVGAGLGLGGGVCVCAWGAGVRMCVYMCAVATCGLKEYQNMPEFLALL